MTEAEQALLRLQEIEKKIWILREEAVLLMARTPAPVGGWPAYNDPGIEHIKRVIDILSKERDRYLDALSFYADPETYFAIGFFPDPPCGPFMDDFSDMGDLGMKPGAKARAALNVIGTRLSTREELIQQTVQLQMTVERLMKDLQEISDGCGVRVPDREEAKRRIIAYRKEADDLRARIERALAVSGVLEGQRDVAEGAHAKVLGEVLEALMPTNEAC